jgi:protein SCO1/2
MLAREVLRSAQDDKHGALRRLCLLLFVLIAFSAPALAISPNDLSRIGYDQHIGQQISRELSFETSEKRTVTIGQLLNTKPTLLVPGYYHCPMLCTLINDGLIESLQELRFDIGKDFNVVNVSIDPNETPAVAAAKKEEYLRRYGRHGAADGWHFLTGDKQTIAQLANEAGFRFEYDPGSHEYAHPSGFLVLTPDGRVSRYFFGVNYNAKELRSALIAASKGQRGSVITQLILLCYHYNPITGRYGALVLNVLRGFSIVTVLLLAGWIAWMCRRSAATAGLD